MDTVDFVKTRQVREVTVTLTYEDTAAAEAFKLPLGARILGWILNVKTAFSGGTTTVDIGNVDTDYYVDGASVASAGQTVPSTLVLHPGPELTAITPIYMSVGASNTVGEVDVTCLFSMVTDRRF